MTTNLISAVKAESGLGGGRGINLGGGRVGRRRDWGGRGGWSGSFTQMWCLLRPVPQSQLFLTNKVHKSLFLSCAWPTVSSLPFFDITFIIESCSMTPLVTCLCRCSLWVGEAFAAGNLKEAAWSGTYSLLTNLHQCPLLSAPQYMCYSSSDISLVFPQHNQSLPPEEQKTK